MFCSQCGKKVRENMLFCLFCGAVIEIPDQGEGTVADALPAEASPAPEPMSEPMVEPEDEPEVEPEWEYREDAADEPLPEGEPAEKERPFTVADWRADEPEWMQDLPDEAEPPAPEPSVEKPAPPPHRPKLAAQHPPRVSGSALDLDVRSSEARHYGKAGPSPLNGGGLFMEEKSAPKPRKRDAYDDYDDPYDADEEDEGDVDSFEDDEPGFLLRHLRSVVGLLLFLILAVIVFVYVLSPKGQEALAKANLAWRSDVYSRLGASSYNSGQYDQAGLYYERALSRTPDSYAYASSAARCYLDAANTQKAAEMLKKCIALQPDALDPYIYLLDLYPNAISRPLEVTQLIEQGYQRTGSDRLKLD